MPTKLAKRPMVLIVRDGWGHNPDAGQNSSNAVYLAKKPVTDQLMATYPNTLIKTSGFEVGLPAGTMGNSEVGHQNIGAGRIVDQDSGRISKLIVSGEFFANPQLNAAVDSAVAKNSALHLFGLVSDAGVHSLMEHLYACLELAKRKGLGKVFIHCFMDGRDTSQKSGLGFIKDLEKKAAQIGVGQVASVIGRYWAMDRDNRWDRVERAFGALALGVGEKFASAQAAVQSYYDQPLKPNMVGDEFIPPSLICDDGVTPRALVKSGDSVIFFNFRGDRPRELTKAFVLDTFPYEAKDKDGNVAKFGFSRAAKMDLCFVTMTAYEKGLPVQVAFIKPSKMKNILGEYLSNLGLKQLRAAETEKFAHVTFFCNDYREEPFPGEDRALIASPRVATYDQKPEMSAPEVADEVAKRIDSGAYDFVLINFANGDMVGHTGNLPAAILAVQAVDAAVGKVWEAVKRQGGMMVVTADHGNAEEEIDPATHTVHTAHTTFDVPLIVADDRFVGKTIAAGGKLADVAPTCLFLMGLPKPAEMTGHSLVGE